MMPMVGLDNTPNDGLVEQLRQAEEEHRQWRLEEIRSGRQQANLQTLKKRKPSSTG